VRAIGQRTACQCDRGDAEEKEHGVGVYVVPRQRLGHIARDLAPQPGAAAWGALL
jgi:hypothetical protein